MNRHNFTPLPKTEFQYRSAMIGYAADAVRKARDIGFADGQIDGHRREKRRRRLSQGKAMCIGFIFGIAACATVTALYMGWQS